MQPLRECKLDASVWQKPKSWTTSVVVGYEETVLLFIASRNETDLASIGSDLVTSVNILSTYKLLYSNYTPKTKTKA